MSRSSISKFGVFAVAMIASWMVGSNIPPTWVVEQISLDVQTDAGGALYYVYGGDPTYFDAVPAAQSQLDPEVFSGSITAPPVREEFVSAVEIRDGQPQDVYYQRLASFHWGIWSLLPALVAVILCWITREPVTALLSGIVSGALILGRYDLTGEVLIPSLATTGAAGILILYLWLLGGLMGIWTRTGAAQAFAEFVTKRFVRGPRTAKLVAWMLGIVFFQGGTVSTVLVGTTVKPIADKERISHEELAYIVDSTASPIASQLAFNAWPGYVQAFIFVSGVGFLATEADRIAFFFQSVPFCFYAIFAVLGTFLLSIEKPLFLGAQLREAITRSRTTGQLNAPGADPLSSRELQGSNVPEGYKPHVIEFFLPLGVLISLAILTFVVYGTPNVHWAFGAAVLLAAGMALAKGMSLKDLIGGFHERHQGRRPRLRHSAPRHHHRRAEPGNRRRHLPGRATRRQHPVFPLAGPAANHHRRHRVLHGHELGHLCRGVPAGHAPGLGRGGIPGSCPPGAVHDALFRGGDGRQRVRRSVLAHFRYHGAQLRVHRLRSDGSRQDTDSAGVGGRRPRRRVLDRGRLPHGLIGSGTFK